MMSGILNRDGVCRLHTFIGESIYVEISKIDSDVTEFYCFT